jgi:hypothetical protein
MAITVIDFEDFGQGFTQWKANETGQIIACTPNQAAFWEGRLITNIQSLMEGSRAQIKSYKGRSLTIRYVITKIQYE